MGRQGKPAALRHTHTESRQHTPVIIWLEGAVLVQAHVLGLLVRKLRQMSVEVRQVQTGHVLVCGKNTRVTKISEPATRWQC